jgi:tetratricopeptide (TPR) repeat protein
VSPPHPHETDPGNRAAFVGRQAELDRLAAILEQAIAGSGAVVFVTGEPGLGKTMLVGEFLRRIREGKPSVTVGRGRCTEHSGPGEAYLPFLDAAGKLLLSRGRERWAELLRRYAPTACLQLPGLSDAEEASLRARALGATQERMLRETGDIIEAAAHDFPVVLLIEDLQWADPPSLEMLNYLGRRIARQRTLFVVTFRPSDVESGPDALRRCVLDLRGLAHAHEICLEPFSVGDVEAYLRARFGIDRPPHELSAAIHERTDGLPLFVTGLIDYLVQRGSVVKRDGESFLEGPLAKAGGLEIPDSLQAMVRHRLDGLADADRTALQHASVIGMEFLSTVLADLLAVDELVLQERLRRLDRVHGLIELREEEDLPGGVLATRYRFTHGLYQEVLYDEIVAARRVVLHRRVAESLSGRYRDRSSLLAATLAEHSEKGRDFARAATYRRRAGDNAAQRYAYAEAQRQYTWALSLLARRETETDGSEELQLYERRGAVRHAAADFDAAALDFGCMLERARVQGAPALECAALAGVCDALFFTRRLEEMAVFAHEALDAAVRSGQEPWRARALLHVARALLLDGRPEQAIPLLDEVIAVARRLGDARELLGGLVYRGFLHYCQSQFTAADERFAEAMEKAERLGDGFMFLASRMFVGLSLANEGRISEALRSLEETAELARTNEDRFWRPMLVSHLGWIRRELQAFDEARGYDEEALGLARAHPAGWAQGADALINLCVDYAHTGRIEEAERTAVALKGVTSRGVWLHVLRMESALCEQSLAVGDLARARASAERLLDAARRHDATTYLAAAHRHLASVALGADAFEEAETHLASAVEHIQRRPVPLEAWKAFALLGRVRSKRGDQAGAQQSYRAAATVVERLAETVTDAGLRETFLSSAAVREVLAGAAAG